MGSGTVSVQAKQLIGVVISLEQLTFQGRVRFRVSGLPASNVHQAVEHETDSDYPHDRGRVLAECRIPGSHFALRPFGSGLTPLRDFSRLIAHVVKIHS